MIISLTKDEVDALFCCLLVATEGLDEHEDKTLLTKVHNIEKKMKEAIVRDTLKKGRL